MLPSLALRSLQYALLWQLCITISFGIKAKRGSVKPKSRTTHISNATQAYKTTPTTPIAQTTKHTTASSLTTTEKDYSDEILAVLRREKLIGPELVSYPPPDLVKVSYKSRPVHLGTEFDSDEVVDDPIHVSWPYDKGELFTFMVIGPDCPSMNDTNVQSWEHWVIGNIPGNNLTAGTVLSEYVGIVGPEYQIGPHRLVFLVYRQRDNEIIEFEESLLEKKMISMMRAAFAPKDLVNKYAMGRPIAFNYCLVHQRKVVFVQPVHPTSPKPTTNDYPDYL